MVFKKNNKIWLGRKHSEETKRKMVVAHIGKKHSNGTKQKMSRNNQGNKNPRYGIKMTENQREKIRKANLGNTWEKLYGEEEAEKRKKEKSIKMRGEGNHFYGKKHKEETRKKISLARQKQNFPLDDTKIEKKIQRYLISKNIDFIKHKHINIKHGYNCDIFIPSLKLVIECDGNYWHNYPYGNEIDVIRNKEMRNKGMKVIRLWENEIKAMRKNDFDNLIMQKGGFI